MSAWQPIEAAPKDGSYFLGGYWINAGRRWMATAMRYRWSNCRGLPVGGYAEWVDLGAHKRNPTHWQPLPAPPEST